MTCRSPKVEHGGVSRSSRKRNERTRNNRSHMHGSPSDECIYIEDEEEISVVDGPLGSVASSLNASRVSSDDEESEDGMKIDDDAIQTKVELQEAELDEEESDRDGSTEALYRDERPRSVATIPAARPPTAKIPRLSRDLMESTTPDNFTCPVPLKERRIWPKRNESDEILLMQAICHEICWEDIEYLKAGIYTREIQNDLLALIPQERRPCLAFPCLDTSIPRNSPNQLTYPIKTGGCEQHFDDPDLEGVIPHPSGCARTEGYYKISKQRKRLVRRHEDYNGRTVISEEDLTAIRCQQIAAKDERATYRRLATSIGADSILLKVNQLKYRRKSLKFARSRIHGWGLYALENIQQEEMIIEYVGEKIRPNVADERERKYERRGMGSSYMFRIDGDTVIDATMMGNFGRFINHSCQPNCTARVVTVEGDKRIVIYSKRLIEKGEEITYDYKFNREDEASKIECLCGAKNCQKFLN